MLRLDAAHGFHRQHEIRLHERIESTVGNVGLVGADVRVVPAHHRPHAFQGAPPAAVGIVRHQGDEDRELFMRGAGRKGGREFELRGNGAQAPYAFQRGNGLEPGAVARQPRPYQPSRRAERLRPQTPQAGLQFVRR